MLRRFTTAGTLSDLPLKMARGATAPGPERIPGMTAVAGPVKTDRRPGSGASDNGSAGRRDCEFRETSAPPRPLAAEEIIRPLPKLPECGSFELLHLDNSRPWNARQGCGEFDGGEEAKVVVRDLLQQVRSINPQALPGPVENRAEDACRWPVFLRRVIAGIGRRVFPILFPARLRLTARTPRSASRQSVCAGDRSRRDRLPGYSRRLRTSRHWLAGVSLPPPLPRSWSPIRSDTGERLRQVDRGNRAGSDWASAGSRRRRTCSIWNRVF